jgi:hypothetical protein
MLHPSARTLLILGFILVMLGFILPLLEVMRILESTFFLNFFAYAASISGVFLGVIGVAYYTAQHRRKK